MVRITLEFIEAPGEMIVNRIYDNGEGTERASFDTMRRSLSKCTAFEVYAAARFDRAMDAEGHNLLMVLREQHNKKN